MAELKSEQDIVRVFSEKRSALNQTWSKITELTAEAAEHELVLKALEPMEPGRKCFRLVGEVLVERTVAEVLPAVKKNKDNLEGLIATLEKQLDQQKQDLSEFQTKYKVRLRTQADEEEEERVKDTKTGAQGVLVAGSS